MEGPMKTKVPRTQDSHNSALGSLHFLVFKEEMDMQILVCDLLIFKC